MARTPAEILRDLVTDVDAMKHDNGVGGNSFGWFDWDNWNDDDAVLIDWPNLSILIEEAREALK